MSLLSKYSLEAERARGLVFQENFVSPQEVALNDGTLVGTLPVKNGVGDFTTASKGITYLNMTDFAKSNTASIIMDVNITFISGAYQTLFGVRSTAGVSCFVFAIDNTASTTAKKLYWTNNTNAITSTATFTSGRHQVAVTHDSSNNVIFYVDGAKLGDTVATLAISPNQNTMYMGISPTGTLYMDALCYKTRVFNAVLTAQEILDYYNNATFTYSSKAIINLPMTMSTYDPTNTKLLDLSGKGNDFTYTAAASFVKNATKGITISSPTITRTVSSFANGTYSIIATIRKTLDTGSQYILDARTAGGTGYFWMDGSKILTGSSGTFYADGNVVTTARGQNLQVVGVTGITLSNVSVLALFVSLNACVYDFILIPGTLTPLQMLDAAINLKKQINTI